MLNKNHFGLTRCKYFQKKTLKSKFNSLTLLVRGGNNWGWGKFNIKKTDDDHERCNVIDDREIYTRQNDNTSYFADNGTLELKRDY